MPHKRAKKSVRDAEHKKKGYNLVPTTSSYDDAPRGAMRIINSLSTQQAFKARGGKTSEDTGERRPKPKAKSSETTGVSPSNAKLDKGKGKAETKPKETKEKKDKVPGIMPHETLGEYNRRVESILRPGVSAAIKSANARKAEELREAQKAKEDRKRKAKGAADEQDEKEEEAGGATGKSKGKKRKYDVNDPALEFASAPTTRRLNDIAEAPPQLPHLRVAGKNQRDSVWAAKGAGKSGLSAAQERILADERERVIKRYRELKANKEAEKELDRERAVKGKPKLKKAE